MYISKLCAYKEQAEMGWSGVFFFLTLCSPMTLTFRGGGARSGGGVACQLRLIIKTRGETLLFPTHTRSRKTDWGVSQTVKKKNKKNNNPSMLIITNNSQRRSGACRAPAAGCRAGQGDLDHLRTICMGSIRCHFKIKCGGEVKRSLPRFIVRF